MRKHDMMLYMSKHNNNELKRNLEFICESRNSKLSLQEEKSFKLVINIIIHTCLSNKYETIGHLNKFNNLREGTSRSKEHTFDV